MANAGNAIDRATVNRVVAQDASYLYENVYQLAKRRAAQWGNCYSDAQFQAAGFDLVADAALINEIRSVVQVFNNVVALFENQVPVQSDWRQACVAVLGIS